ncbi:MAG: AbrB/MazE/SpoVT family DNA-binding domain-containing protein [Ferroplasma sp.]
MEKKTKICPKGQVVIPKNIREIMGIAPNSDVVISLKNDKIIIERSKPLTETYYEYYINTYSKKLKKEIDINKILEKEYDRNLLH